MKRNRKEFFYGVIGFIILCILALGWSEEETPTEKEEVVTFSLAPTGEEALPESYRIESDELLDYDAEKGIIYGKRRTRVYYGKYYVEADILILDDKAKEVQASGNVILRSPLDEVKADYVRYNFEKNLGYATGVYGRHRYLFYKSPEKEEKPAFLRLGKEEVLLRNASITSCDFTIPHYRIRAKEFLVYTNERIFARSAFLYVWEVPVFYFPFYSRSLREHSPWSFVLGTSSRLGAYVKIGYDYWHYLYEPAISDEREMVRRSGGHLAAHIDYFSRRGIGYGFTYKYGFNFDRHRGEMLLYNLGDKDRKIEGERKYKNRWVVRILHRSEILKDLVFLLNVDEFSDPEVYWEFIGPFEKFGSERRPERRARASLTWRRDDYVARILVEIKDRISRDRVTNFSEPGDDDLDFDEDPYNLYGDDDNEGLPRKRFGRVTKRYPQITFSTRELKIEELPLYYNAELNIINNLDRGLNLISKEDDAFVRGADLYQRITHILRFNPRYTLLSKFGVGISYFQREDYDYHYDLPPGTVFPTVFDNMAYADENTFLMGKRRRSLEDVERFTAYADAELRFNARFTDYLTGYLRYKFRESTDDSLGEFYESIGDRHIKSDLYNFRTKEHFIEARLNYFLAQPKLNLYLTAWQNLQGKSDIYANERLTLIGLGSQYKNQLETFIWDTFFSYERRQIFDPTHPDEFQQGTIYGNTTLSYIPKHQRWWTRLSASAYHILDEGPLERTRGIGWWVTEYGRRREKSSFYEQDTFYTIEGILGGKIGPKYVLEGRVGYDSAYDGLKHFKLILKRDLHDFIASFLFSAHRSVFDYTDDEDRRGGKWEWDVRFALEFKAPFKRRPIGASTISTLVDTYKEVLIEEEL